MKIPYGQADFAGIRREGYYYADKTMFLPQLESAEGGRRFLLLLRPRRFGKSLLISLLEHYYDLLAAPQFEALFKGLWIYDHPTPERNAHLILRFDFSSVDTSGDETLLRATFLSVVQVAVQRLLARQGSRFPVLTGLQAKLDAYEDPVSLIKALLEQIGGAGQSVYVLIDEYDNFANDLLALGRGNAYHDLMGATGFVRAFYKTLKEYAGKGIVARLFATGVTPMMLDDLASGFNIVQQITFDPHFNALCGFTRAEVEQAVDAFIALTPDLAPRAQLLEDLERFYNGYLFAVRGTERIYNPELVLYYLAHWRNFGEVPREMMDINVKVDYSKLRMIASPPGGVQTWQLERLETLMSEGQLTGTLVERFSARGLYDEGHFITLLQCMGLLTIDGYARGQLTFRIPNLVSARMHWEELTRMFRQLADAVVNTADVQRAVAAMAYEGELGPFVEVVQAGVLEKLSRRDLRLFDERGVKVVLLSYLSLSPIYIPVSELEHREGFSDLFLGLDGRFPDAKYTWLLELKYLKAGAKAAKVEVARKEALEQLDRYLSDETVLRLLRGGVGPSARVLRAATLVVVGMKECHWKLEREV